MFIKIIPCNSEEPTYIHAGDIVEIMPRPMSGGDEHSEIRLRDGGCLRVMEAALSIINRLNVIVV